MSDPQKTDLVEAVMTALELGTREREEYLRRLGAEDSSLAAEVARLIARHELDSGRALREPPEPDSGATIRSATIKATTQPGEGPGSQIDGYKLLQQIGEGGFGMVFMADQQRPVQRRVALKIIKLGMDTHQVIARFEAERQALAMMDHANIARVLDAGATQTGRPYFVMELVTGEPITAYCDRNNLSVPERLELFEQVCHAVQHAHQKGIIHRDIKPSNILVGTQDGRPFAKVIDFGIAKATGGRLTERTLFTEHKVLIGTPEYMSPEQAEGSLDIDTRTDVYSLGVLLYELLTGTTPFESNSLRDAGYAEIERIIREVEPPKPSTRLSQSAGTLASVAAHRRSEPRKLGSIVRGELDWIVMRALEKDRSRRYESANGLAEDVRRYLAGESVVAAPPSQVYLIRKFVRRNRGPVAAGAAVLVALVAGLGGTLWQARVASLRAADAKLHEGVAKAEAAAARLAEAEQRRLAEAEAQAAQAERRAHRTSSAINDFMMYVLAPSDPVESGDQGVLVADAMLQAMQFIGAGRLKSDPHAEGAVRHMIATALTINGRHEEAFAIAKAELEAARQLLPEGHHDIARSMSTVGLCLANLERYEEALAMQEASFAIVRGLTQDDQPEIAGELMRLGKTLTELGRFDEAHSKYQAAYEMYQRMYEGDHRSTAGALCGAGIALTRSGRLREALPKLQAALEMRQRLFPKDHNDVALSLSSVATCLQKLGRATEALPLNEASLEMRKRLHKGDHTSVATGLTLTAELLRDLGRLDGALERAEAALGMCERLYKGDNLQVASAAGTVGMCLQSLGREAEALTRFQAALDIRSRLLSGDHPDMAWTLDRVASCLNATGRSEEAVPKFESAIAMYQRLFPGDNANVARTMNNFAVCLNRLKRRDEALATYESALAMHRRLFAGDHPSVARGLDNVGVSLRNLERPAEALPRFEAALAMNRRLRKGDHPDLVGNLSGLAQCLGKLGRWDEALKAATEGAEMARRCLREGHPARVKSEKALETIRARSEPEKDPAPAVK